ncbi:MAG: hypothetical protein WC997_08230 [Porticoccaceae bacterium]
MSRTTTLNIHLTPAQLALTRRLSQLIDIPDGQRTSAQYVEMLSLSNQLARRLTPAIVTAVRAVAGEETSRIR